MGFTGNRGFWLPSITQGCCLCYLIHLLHRVDGVSDQQLTKQTTVLQNLADKALSAADTNFISFPCAPLILPQVARHLLACVFKPPPNHHQTTTSPAPTTTKATLNQYLPPTPTTFTWCPQPSTASTCLTPPKNAQHCEG